MNLFIYFFILFLSHVEQAIVLFYKKVSFAAWRGGGPRPRRWRPLSDDQSCDVSLVVGGCWMETNWGVGGESADQDAAAAAEWARISCYTENSCVSFLFISPWRFVGTTLECDCSFNPTHCVILLGFTGATFPAQTRKAWACAFLEGREGRGNRVVVVVLGRRRRVYSESAFSSCHSLWGSSIRSRPKNSNGRRFKCKTAGFRAAASMRVWDFYGNTWPLSKACSFFFFSSLPSAVGVLFPPPPPSLLLWCDWQMSLHFRASTCSPRDGPMCKHSPSR